MRLHRLLVLTVILATLASAAHAQSGPQPGWAFYVTPYAWLPSLSGTLRTPLPRVGDKSFGVSSGTVVSDLDAVPAMIAGEARYGRFSVVGDFFYAALQQDLNTHDVLWQGGHTRVTSTVGNLLGLFRIFEEPHQSIDVGAGARIWNFNNKVSLSPGLGARGDSGRSSVSWSDPLVATRYHAMLSPRFGVTAYADIGGFDTGSRLTWQAIGSLDYELTDQATLRAGWRYLSVDKKSGSISLDLGFNGPFLAASLPVLMPMSGPCLCSPAAGTPRERHGAAAARRFSGSISIPVSLRSLALQDEGEPSAMSSHFSPFAGPQSRTLRLSLLLVTALSGGVLAAAPAQAQTGWNAMPSPASTLVPASGPMGAGERPQPVWLDHCRTPSTRLRGSRRQGVLRYRHRHVRQPRLGLPATVCVREGEFSYRWEMTSNKIKELWCTRQQWPYEQSGESSRPMA
ncbi:hypothetical protein [Dankookia sp. P2]|uniref:hypothetical protein n=1 Tax=Dankookia sp. P2 TaxID=3423955 RepID=UPI003D66BC93